MLAPLEIFLLRRRRYGHPATQQPAVGRERRCGLLPHFPTFAGGQRRTPARWPPASDRTARSPGKWAGGGRNGPLPPTADRLRLALAPCPRRIRQRHRLALFTSGRQRLQATTLVDQAYLQRLRVKKPSTRTAVGISSQRGALKGVPTTDPRH